jgi:hypothetical protein
VWVAEPSRHTPKETEKWEQGQCRGQKKTSKNYHECLQRQKPLHPENKGKKKNRGTFGRHRKMKIEL